MTIPPPPGSTSKVCGTCAKIKPATEDFYPKGSKVCQVCTLRADEQELTVKGYDARTKALSHINKSISSGFDLQSDQDLLRCIYREFGGVDGVAQSMKELYDDVDTKSREKTTILKSIVNLVEKISRNQVEREIAGMSDAELSGFIIDHVTQMAEIVDVTKQIEDKGSRDTTRDS